MMFRHPSIELDKLSDHRKSICSLETERRERENVLVTIIGFNKLKVFPRVS
jgi:hypothetical protein